MHPNAVLLAGTLAHGPETRQPDTGKDSVRAAPCLEEPGDERNLGESHVKKLEARSGGREAHAVRRQRIACMTPAKRHARMSVVLRQAGVQAYDVAQVFSGPDAHAAR